MSSPTLSVVQVTAKTVNLDVTIGNLLADATYEYYLSYSTTDSNEAAMTDGATLLEQSEVQNVTVTGLTDGTQYFLFVRAKNTGTDVYTVLSTASVPLTTLKISVAETIVHVAVNGQSTGSISLSVSGATGPYTFDWSTTLQDEVITQSSLSAGSYSVIVDDSGDADPQTYTYTVLENPIITITPGAVVNTNFSDSTGIIRATLASGGDGGVLTYKWTSTGTAITTEDLSEKIDLAAGVYTLTASDVAGATASHTYTVLMCLAIILFLWLMCRLYCKVCTKRAR
jgi:SprB repeat